MRSILPVTGLRLTWQSNTLMKIDTRGTARSPRSSSFGGTALVMRLTRPSAGAHHDPVADRRHPLRIAEEIDAPERRHGGEPAERRPQPEQEQADQREQADERQALAVDRRQLGANGGENGHAQSITPRRRHGQWAARSPARRTHGQRRSTVGGLRLGATASSPTSSSFSRAASASRWRFHMLA